MDVHKEVGPHIDDSTHQKPSCTASERHQSILAGDPLAQSPLGDINKVRECVLLVEEFSLVVPRATVLSASRTPLSLHLPYTSPRDNGWDNRKNEARCCKKEINNKPERTQGRKNKEPLPLLECAQSQTQSLDPAD